MQKTPMWSTWSELVAVLAYPAHLRRTLTIAAAVGTAFFLMNQLGVILAGHATAIVWFKAALTFLTPVFVSNFGVASATRVKTKGGK